MSELKLHLNMTVACNLATELSEHYPAFDTDSFLAQVGEKLDTLELKARSAWVAEALHAHLPTDYPEAVKILEAILGDPLQEDDSVTDGFYRLMPIAHFVEVYGLEHVDESVHAMYEITKRFSSEFAIRPYLERYPEHMLAILHEWTLDPNEHVRRLVSEGTRPRLPWAGRLYQFIDDPTPTLALLEKLKDDSSLYVRRSVANHLNDIGKDHPELLLDTVERWRVNADANRLWVIKHALRSLIKAGNVRALAVLGYAAPQVRLIDFTASDEVVMPDVLAFSCTLRSTAPQDQELMIDYLVHFMKANGKTAPKVFKLTQKTLAAGEQITIQKSHLIKPITTRVYYAGPHRVEVQVNGQVLGGADFDLVL